MDNRAANRGHSSNKAVRKPLQDTTISANNYSSPTPAHYITKPQSSDYAKDVKQQQHYSHTQERTYSVTPQSKVISGARGRNSHYSTASITTPTPLASRLPKLRKGKAQVGPWLLGRTLGKGSSGRVRLARHFETGQLAAIKIVGKGQQEGHDANGQRQIGGTLPQGLEREVVIMKLISHENVMGLLDVWENRGELYLVLEYIEGGELFDYLTRCGRLAEEEAMKYFRQIISGVDYCQHFNICHRDLKPENLLLDADGNIKIADFGMAALQPQGSLLNTPCGSPHYASPEIVSGKQYDGARSDIWSCGIVLFALLAGHLPFDDENIRDLLQKVMRGRFTMPREFSVEAQDLIWRMLTVDPKARITTEQIWRHPLVKRYAPIDPQTGAEMDRGPKPPSLEDIGRPVKNRNEVDREILKNLQTLWQGVSEKELVEKLLDNVHNQEKVFYCLLMKYRYEHLENYPGAEPAPAYQQPKALYQLAATVTGRNPRQHANNLAYRGNECLRQTGSFASPKRGNNYSLPPISGNEGTVESSTITDNHYSRGSRSQDQPDRSGGSMGRHLNGDVSIHHRPGPPLRTVASRSSITNSTRYGNRSGGRRRYHSRSSLASHLSNSPSAYRPTRPSLNQKRQVSFNRQGSRNAKGDRTKLTIRNDANHEVWVDDNEQHSDLGREDTPTFEEPLAVLPPKGRKESASITKRRSAVVIDGQVLDGGYASAAQSLRMSFLREDEEAKRRRMVSKELEEACEKAFNSSAVRSSFATLSTVKSDGTINDESIVRATDINNPSDSMDYSIEVSRPATAIQHLYAADLDGTNTRQLPNLPPHELVRKRSDGRNTLRIFGDGENDPDKGCLDDVIEHLDRLMDSSAKLHTIEQLRAVSQGGMPLNLGGTLVNSKNHPALIKQYLDQEERDHQQYLVARANLRNVSTPNPHRNSTMSSHGQGRKPVSNNAKSAPLEPAPLNIRPRSDRKPMGETPRSETRATIRAVNEALRFDASMPTPELNLPIREQEVKHDGPRFVSGNWNLGCMEASELVPSKGAKDIKKKRSFLDILTGKKAAKDGKSKAKSVDEKDQKVPSTPHTLGPSTFDYQPTDAINIEKGTFGRRSGNMLRRLVSRDAKKELELGNENKTELGSTPDGGNPLSLCFAPMGHMSDGEATRVPENQDEFSRVMGQRNWFRRVLNVKPASRIIYFNVSALQCRKEVLKLYKDWLKHGLLIVEDDRRGLVIRARVGNPNTLNIKEVTFVGEIRTSNGTKRAGTSVVQFTQEKGAASSFNRVMDEITLICSLKGLLAEEE